MDVIITGFNKPTNEGVVLHFNKPVRLKTGNVYSCEVWVSWDKIGEALVDGYTEKMAVDERNKLRDK
jgi:hypothetical protein